MLHTTFTVIALTALLSSPWAMAQETQNKKPSTSPDSKSLTDDSTDSTQARDEKTEPKTEEQIKLEEKKNIEKASDEIFGVDPKNKFSLYQPTYFIFGKDDLKLQFSGKYRVAKSYNLYLAYTQTMFWSIYESSAPFDDINYNPEAFYRLVENKDNFLRSIDIGFLHTSNGEDEAKSRSINRYFVKTNFATSLGRHNILGELKLQNIYSKASGNQEIVDHMGYWELKMLITHILVAGTSRLDVEYTIFAGKKLIDIDQGGRTLGLLYHLGSENFNPAFYFQYYSGYAENLLHYKSKQSNARLGLLLFF